MTDLSKYEVLVGKLQHRASATCGHPQKEAYLEAIEAIRELSTRVLELESQRTYYTCAIGKETFSTDDKAVADVWREDFEVHTHVADDERVLALDAENKRLRDTMKQLMRSG